MDSITAAQRDKLAREVMREQAALETQRYEQELHRASVYSTASSATNGRRLSANRPMADPNAFMTNSEVNQFDRGVWQKNMSPSDRAKELASEMKAKQKMRGQVREKMVKVGDKVMRVE
ncbi:hypothetical protein PHYBLDRAFT_139152 [Phycomyces blakesleeanus NRRL 1555(-)]|uniref:Uncharacterized protein n=1 Tax=Phycomyces blakesleeanus (strain ATCC 8743b / DSM 1359 / FGSC 10004 / NBRC 33097 / NRRL 1555) TaxID=763407 RepID=A0A167Q5U1_PHYB8|nr:hypothetical protein PHYBLDRAFT_139152 [Phycomyces blakesleeanus NRRL 1555(-)]OAD79117.1 hypothetical protein PHYBLDRAFT_139152 [Phycomyces blakesleeanus NRRL 1555(-)]|eukprot:XP_018297157.1 hypothetical protein PHYBLDRAFT_139152 [Phycomyces blakesleeanus NRRL 1555(-)]